MKKKSLRVLISISLAFILLVGCGQQAANIKDNNSQQLQEPKATTRVLKDMSGREVEIPVEVKKVFSTSSTGSALIYTLAPEKLAGWNSELRENEKPFIALQYQNLPDLGRWKGTSYTGNNEELLKAAPDLIISVGDVSEGYISEANEIQTQLGIPVLMVDGSLQKTGAAYRFLGEVMGEADRAEKLAAYCDKTLEAITSNLQSLADTEKVAVYYGQGVEGLETEISGTVNSEAFDISGAKNVAVPETAGIRRMQVSLEQILKWDPEVIIISTDGDKSHSVYNSILKEKGWSEVRAVKNKEVYEIPGDPYDWINRPPSVVRFIGVQWLSSLLYPDVIKSDLQADIKEFYSLFYRYEISDSEVEVLLQNSLRN
ncbi:MAG: ABC transporter substrate-binding protein [Bacillota bacterium]